MNLLSRHIGDFFSLFFPEVCAGCGCSLVGNEEEICTSCLVNLPYTDFHMIPDNGVARQFWGRVPFIFCGAYLYFSKGTRVQNLLHQLKYNNRPEVGMKLGVLYGKQLLGSPSTVPPDVIVPVPLHPKRQKKRGYNQSEYFALGLSKTMQVPINTSTLQRGTFTSSQTKKSRFSRYENMKDVFFLIKGDEFEGKHILLVDDIITTGATIEACAMPILKIPETTISIAGIAYTD